MRSEHKDFVLEYIRTGDKAAAYQLAYPDNKPESAYSSAKRLLTRPDIKEVIEESRNRMRKEAEEEIKDEMKGEILSAHNAQVILSQIITGQHVVIKEVNVKGTLEKVEVRPTHSAIISALNVFFRLNNMYPQKMAIDRKAEKAAEAHEAHEKWKREVRPLIPQWPVDQKHRHPYGDTYPLSYRGPYFDPKDPNTREQFLTLMERFRKEALEKGETTEHYDKHLQSKAAWDKQHYELFYGSPNDPVSATVGNNTDQVSLLDLRRGAGVVDSRSADHTNETPISATTSNNTNQVPLLDLRRGGGVVTDHTNETPISATSGNNQQQSNLPSTLQSDWIPKDGGYITIYQALEYCRKDRENNRPFSHLLFEHLQYMSRGVNKHPNIRAAAERATGWQYHPVEHYLIRPKLDSYDR